LDFNMHNRQFYLPSGDQVPDATIEEGVSKYCFRGVERTDFFVQVRLLPASTTLSLSTLCPFSYRAITLADQRGHYSIIRIYAKSATGNNFADNRHAGGLTCLLDRNGVCAGARSQTSGAELMEMHPTTSFRLKGWEPPQFVEVCDLALKAASAFPFLKCVAWDIAVAKEGVFLLEGNNPWNKDVQEVYDEGLWKDTFEREASLAIATGPSKSPWW